MPEKTVAIVQSNYIPWKGYFDLINLVDEFILYDDAQYTKRDWRNRNRIKTANGLQWLTIPVDVKGRYHQRICDARISDPDWGRQHWATLCHHYARAPFFDAYRDALEPLYLHEQELMLSRVNRTFLQWICDRLGIATPLRWSMDYAAEGTKTERLVGLCRAAGATRYLSGPAAKAYLDEAQFQAVGITVTYMDYAGYPEYPQPHGPFEHGVTILDLLFNVGPRATAYMRSFH